MHTITFSIASWTDGLDGNIVLLVYIGFKFVGIVGLPNGAPNPGGVTITIPPALLLGKPEPGVPPPVLGVLPVGIFPPP